MKERGGVGIAVLQGVTMLFASVEIAKVRDRMSAFDSILAFSQAGEAQTSALDHQASLERAARVRQALTLWLRWNAAYEQTTSRMFQPGANLDALQQIMDDVDTLRRQAVEMSRDLL